MYRASLGKYLQWHWKLQYLFLHQKMQKNEYEVSWTHNKEGHFFVWTQIQICFFHTIYPCLSVGPSFRKVTISL